MTRILIATFTKKWNSGLGGFSRAKTNEFYSTTGSLLPINPIIFLKVHLVKPLVVDRPGEVLRVRPAHSGEWRRHRQHLELAPLQC